MKKEYTKPVMEIVSFTSENAITLSAASTSVDYGYQKSSKITTIAY
ncbi:MAG: hypothetical protein LUD81_05470 [Clostridiales bacterium]|nr:hypothetical protein [Clostridiales bacterium]